MSRPEPPDAPGQPKQLEVYDPDPVPVVAAGTVLWFVAFLVLLALRDRLSDAGEEQWVWRALVGGCLGLVGTALCVRRRRRGGLPTTPR